MHVCQSLEIVASFFFQMHNTAEQQKNRMNISERFLRGLQQHNISMQEIVNGVWKYCGGSKGRHYRYFVLSFPDKQLPDARFECVCGHRIRENCYITDGQQILVLGNCCIKRFVPKSGRTCSVCSEPHRNRIVNRCNRCRKGVCDICGCRCNMKYKLCFGCWSCKSSR